MALTKQPRKSPRADITVQGLFFGLNHSGPSVHLIELPQGGENSLEVVEVEARADLQVGDLPHANPVVDGAWADGEPLGEFLLLDQGGLDGT